MGKRKSGVGTVIAGIGSTLAGTLLSSTGWVSVGWAKFLTIFGFAGIAIGLGLILAPIISSRINRGKINAIKTELPLKIIFHNATVGMRQYDNNQQITQFLIRLTLISPNETQLDNLYLEYDRQSYPPVEKPTILVKGTQSYDIEYRVPGSAGLRLAKQGYLQNSGGELVQAHFSVVGGGLNGIATKPFPIPVTENWLASHKEGYQIL